MPGKRRKPLGRYVVADPRICHGKLTFVGTRILVGDVLEMVAQGMTWSTIVKECHGSIDEEAIGEAVRLAGQVLQKQAEHGKVFIQRRRETVVGSPHHC
jgi:uncharacterized protein (DUF433 family)